MMSHKGSATTVQKNKDIWTANLVQYQQSHKRRRIVPVEESSIEEKCRMPHQIQIIDDTSLWEQTANIKGRKERIVEISKEVKFSICVRSSNTSKA